MIALIRIAAVFSLILVGVRLKWHIGLVLLLASASFAILYSMPISVIQATIVKALTDPVSVQLFFVLTLIRMVEMLLRENNVLARMMEASRMYLKNKKAVIVSMPLLIGMLPSLGGAYFSAPMVEESTKGMHLSPEEKSFINYWFRHVWEPILPLYPGMLFASALSGLDIRQFILANSVFAGLIVITGFLFSMRTIQGRFRHEPGPESLTLKKDWHILYSFIPLAGILFAVIVLHMDMITVLVASIVLLMIFYRSSWRDVIRILRYGFTRDVVQLIVGTMIFKFMLDDSGAVQEISRYLTEQQIPLLPILCILPFIVGVLTGLVVAVVGSTFPLIMHIAGGASLADITLAFAAGYAGVLLSPVHLCLVLTREYFKADLAKVYRPIAYGTGISMLGAFVVYVILRT
jgi:integral membrane protein (TIGR00529 family)